MLDRSIQPPILEPEHLKVMSPEHRVMPNGIPLYILNAGDNEVVRIDLLMKGGRWQQSKRLQALFANRMLREGTRRYTAADIAEKLDYYGAWLQLSSSSEYSFVTLYSLNKYLPQVLDVFESIVKEPVFPEKELGVVVDNNARQFLVNSSKVGYLAHRALMSALYGDGHPCGQLVNEEDYHSISSSLLQSFYDCHYHSGNCSIYLSGKISEDAINRIQDTFGNEPFGKGFATPVKHLYIPVTSPQKRFFAERDDAMQSAVSMGMVSIDNHHPDFLKTRVLITLFGGYFGSRLMSNIREDKGYTYDISAAIASYPDTGLFVINTQTTNEYVEPLIKEVYNEVDKLQNQLVSDSELALVRNYMLGSICRSYESAFSLADAWIFIHTSGFSGSYITDSVDAVKSVTPEEIRELACRYLCKESLKESVSGKKMS